MSEYNYDLFCPKRWGFSEAFVNTLAQKLPDFHARFLPCFRTGTWNKRPVRFPLSSWAAHNAREKKLRQHRKARNGSR